MRDLGLVFMIGMICLSWWWVRMRWMIDFFLGYFCCKKGGMDGVGVILYGDEWEFVMEI